MATRGMHEGGSRPGATSPRWLQHEDASGAAASRRLRKLAGSADGAASSVVRGPGRGLAAAAGDVPREAAALLLLTAAETAADDLASRGRALAAAVAAVDPDLDPDPEDGEADEEASMLPENRAADAVDPLIEPGCAFQRFD